MPRYKLVLRLTQREFATLIDALYTTKISYAASSEPYEKECAHRISDLVERLHMAVKDGDR